MHNVFVFVAFFIFALITCYGAIKLSDASEDFEKYTKIPPIIIGAILAIATSLPEFATSLTSSIGLGTPVTAIANPIGSNMFNIIILAMLNIVFFKQTINYYLKTNNNIFNSIVIIMYLLTILAIFNPYGIGQYAIWHINAITIIMFVLYAIGLAISGNNDEVIEHEENKQALNKAIVQFIVFAIVVLVCSVVLSLLADEIINITNLKSGFVGAVFLGIATSLPELISSFSLCKNGKYNIACANIIGSNLFNFIIVCINDVFYPQPIWNLMDGSVYPLIYFGLTLSVITFIMIQFKTKNKYINIILPVICIAIYLFYMITSG